MGLESGEDVDLTYARQLLDEGIERMPYKIFDEWFTSLTDGQADEVLRARRSSDVPGWMIASLDEHNIITVRNNTGSEVLLTGALEDYLEMLRSLIPHEESSRR